MGDAGTDLVCLPDSLGSQAASAQLSYQVARDLGVTHALFLHAS